MEEYHMKFVTGSKNTLNAMRTLHIKGRISCVTHAHWRGQFKGANVMIVTFVYVMDADIRAPEDGAQASSAVLTRIRRFTGAKTVS